ncbi:N-acetylmuramoyl-L-alanine amidase [Hafnia paralvei]|uniref:N-acetylmuramoyl-L-alanine amidase n=1 Tax=Hafnia paralvei TaxID=546367 RepID=UPI0010341795|nr:N-acetylmuramoyl-L-alanine amidase [Hafnia paralvei]TBL56150.1 N-acetylmuramoyl-L-alanine amidase [Hafnia paralvei]
MSKYLVVFGHGQGDPGATGNGYQEATFTRNILGPKLKAWAAKLKKNKIDFYNESLDMYQQTKAGGGAYGVNGYASVTEFHLDAATSSSATGGHVIISARFNPDSNDLAIAKVLEKYVGLWGSSKPTGTYKRDDLLNMNVFANRGISYRLVELGFISSAKDVNNLVKNIDAVAKALVEAITGESLSGSANTGSTSKPQSSSNHDKIIEESPAKTVNGMTAKLAKFREEPLGSFREAGWAHAGKENYNYCFIFLMDKATNKEVARQKSKDIPRPDVNAAYKLSSNNKPGFDTTIDIKKFAGKQVYVKVRLTNDPAGNMKGGAKDVDFPEYYLTIPKR